MPELKVNAHELVNTRTDYVSLVKRGANRLPFRIVKAEDEDMLDLHAIGRKMFRKADPVPEIVAVITTSETNSEALAKAFTEAGLDPALFAKSEEGEIITLAKADADTAKDRVIIKTSDDVALVVSGVQKAFDAYSGNSSFSEAFASQSFYPSFYRAAEVLNEVVFHKLQKANTPAEAASMISEVLADFSAYVTVLASSLPQSAFYVDRFYESYMKAEGEAKLEKAVPLGETAEEAATAKEKEVKKDDDAAVEETPAAEAEQVAKTEETPAEPAAEVELAKAEEVPDPAAVTPEPEVEPVAKSEETPVEAAPGPVGIDQAAILATLTEFQKSLTAAMGDIAESLKKDLADVSTRVDEVAVRAQKTEEALNGTVFAEAGGDNPARVTKSAGSDSAPPLLDTAYTPLRA